MLGSSIRQKFTAESTLRAIRHFQRATELDPEFAFAWDRLANTYRIAWLTLGSEERDRWWRLSEEAIGKALALAPNADYAIQTAAYFQTDQGNWGAAHRLFERAATHTSGLKLYTHARLDMLVKTGNIDEALVSESEFRRVDPLHPDFAMYLGQLFLSKGRIDDALAQFEAGMLLEGYRSQISVAGLVAALASRRPDQVRIWLDRAVENEQPGSNRVHTEMRKRIDDAEEALEWVRAQFASSAIPDYYVMVWASYYGDHELAVRAMQRSPDLWSAWTPLLEPIRNTVAFKQTLVDIGLVDYFREYGWNDFCRPLGETDFECS